MQEGGAPPLVAPLCSTIALAQRLLASFDPFVPLSRRPTQRCLAHHHHHMPRKCIINVVSPENIIRPFKNDIRAI